jgi:hypothetical protein
VVTSSDIIFQLLAERDIQAMSYRDVFRFWLDTLEGTM